MSTPNLADAREAWQWSESAPPTAFPAAAPIAPVRHESVDGGAGSEVPESHGQGAEAGPELLVWFDCNHGALQLIEDLGDAHFASGVALTEAEPAGHLLSSELIVSVL